MRFGDVDPLSHKHVKTGMKKNSTVSFWFHEQNKIEIRSPF